MNTCELKQLKNLCLDYTWRTVMGIDIDRFGIHQAICDMLGVEHQDEGLREILSNLEKLGLPEDIRDKEYWNRITRQTGQRLYSKIVEIFCLI